jgi:hypothetical protein
MARSRNVVVLVLAVLLGICVPASAQRVAFVVGNGTYANANALPNPANDAADMASALRDLGFEVIAATDVDKAMFDQKLRDFARLLRGARMALFYYAGHGLQVAGKNYAVPIDARLESAADLSVETVDLDQVLSVMQADENRVNLVFLDACRDNPLTRSFARALPSTRAVSVGTGLSALDAGRGTLIAFATAPHKVALDGRGRNSPFTDALLRHIRTPGLDIAFVMRRVTAEVEKASGGSQIPWVHASLTTDVVLKPGDGVAPTPPVVASVDPQIPALVPTSRVPVPNEPLPADIPVDRDVLKIIETHPFFADAPEVTAKAYAIASTYTSMTSGLGTSETTSNDMFDIRWLRSGLIKLDEIKRWTVNNYGATGSYSSRSTGVSAANGFLNMGYRMTFSSGGKNFTTTSQLTKIASLEGQLFPMRVGNRFSYELTFRWKSSAVKDPGESVSKNSCEVTRRYDAKAFYVGLAGSAYLVTCNSQSIEKKKNETSNHRSNEFFFDALGIWLRVDPAFPREQIITNNEIHVAGKYKTVSNGSYTLQSVALTP